MGYLDENGLVYSWRRIRDYIDDKVLEEVDGQLNSESNILSSLKDLNIKLGGTAEEQQSVETVSGMIDVITDNINSEAEVESNVEVKFLEPGSYVSCEVDEQSFMLLLVKLSPQDIITCYESSKIMHICLVLDMSQLEGSEGSEESEGGLIKSASDVQNHPYIVQCYPSFAPGYNETALPLLALEDIVSITLIDYESLTSEMIDAFEENDIDLNQKYLEGYIGCCVLNVGNK